MEKGERTTTVVILAFVVVACVVLAGLLAAMAWFSRWAPAVFRSEAAPDALIERTFAAGQAPSLEVDNFAGRVTVTAGRAGEIRVTATKKASNSRALERIEVDLREMENGLEMRTLRPSGTWNASVELAIAVPADTRVVVHTGSGAVAARGLQRETRLETGSGSVQLEDLEGPVRGDTGSGGVTARGLRGNLEVDTGSGALELEQIEGDIEAETGSGSISVREASGAIWAQTGSGSIEYEGTPAGDCRFETGSGRIELLLPRDLQMTVDLSTGSGSVETGFAVEGQAERRRIAGTVGGGDQAQIRAHTGSGDIDVMPR